MKKKPVLSIPHFAQIAALLLLLTVMVTFRASAAVDLKSFDAEQVDNDQEVELIWSTGTEEETAFFFILRADSPDDFPTQNNMGSSTSQDAIFVLYNGNPKQLIEAEGTVSTGKDYVATQTDVEYGETYYYLLVEIEESGNVIGQFDKIATVTLVEDDGDAGLGDGDPTPEPTETPTPSPTPSPTPMPTEAADEGEAEPTETPEPEDNGDADATATAEATAEAIAEAEETATAEAEATEAADDADEEEEEEASTISEATATLRPTSTPQPTATQTPPPTNTPAPTATLVPTQAADESEEAPEANDAQEEVLVERTEAVETTGTVVELDSESNSESGGLLAAPVAEAAESEAYPVTIEQGGAQNEVVAVESYPVSDGEVVEVEAVVQDSAESITPLGTANDSTTADNALALSTNDSGATGSVIGGSNNAAAIGSNDSANAANSELLPPAQIDAGDEGGPSIMLWLAFGAGILVFGGGIIGSIIIFTRQREEE